VLWVLSSSVLSLSLSLSLLIPPAPPSPCVVVPFVVVVVVVAHRDIDIPSPSRWLSPFDFQHLKLSPNDLKYPFFLLPHFFFAKTKNQTLKGQSRPAKCNSINKMSWSRSSPNVVIVAPFIVVAHHSPLPPLPPLCPLSPLCSVYLFSGSSSPPFTLGHGPDTDRTRPDTIGYSLDARRIASTYSLDV
jgi:hypothetical protein